MSVCLRVCLYHIIHKLIFVSHVEAIKVCPCAKSNISHNPSKVESIAV